MTEATSINKSLSALGDVIGALSGKVTAVERLGLAGDSPPPLKKPSSANVKFVPYRNSKLTLLLQDALQAQGKAKVRTGSSSNLRAKCSVCVCVCVFQAKLTDVSCAQVVLFVTTSPELAHWNESVSALTFASRCRAVDLSAPAPAVDCTAEAELAAANKKIGELSAKLRQKGGE